MSQHDAQYLLKPANQLAVIDEFGGCVPLRQKFAELFRQRQELATQQKELTTAASRTLRRQQLELYEFQAKEIDDAQLVAGEQAELSARSRMLANLEKIKRTTGAAYGALYEDEGSIIGRLKGTVVVLLEMAELDEALQPLAGQIKEAALNLDDAAFSLRRYVDKLDLDPAELAEVDQRLNLVNRLTQINTPGTHRHGGRSADLPRTDRLADRRTARARTKIFRPSARRSPGWAMELKEVGKQLTAARKKAADRLVPLVHGQLADLGMKEARFLVEFAALDVGIENPKSETRNPKAESKNARGIAGLET